jgi:hypothetical protein
MGIIVNHYEHKVKTAHMHLLNKREAKPPLVHYPNWVGVTIGVVFNKSVSFAVK